MAYHYITTGTWWRHLMEAFSALLALCAENSPITGEFHSQRPVKRGFDVFFDLRLNKRLRKELWGCWFETPPRSLWRHCNEICYLFHTGLEDKLFSAWANDNSGSDAHIWCNRGKAVEPDSTRFVNVYMNVNAQCGSVITRSIFSQILTKDTP